MKKILFVIVVFITFVIISLAKGPDSSGFSGGAVTLKSADGVKVKADVYEIKDKKVPISRLS